MIFGIVANATKDKGYTVLRSLERSILARGGEAVIAESPEGDPSRDLSHAKAGWCAGLARCDVIVSIGGDGTLIRAAKDTAASGVPILGVNRGSLGYLTEVEASELDAMVERLFRREYRVEERMMLRAEKSSGNGESPGGGEALGDAILNEVSIARGLDEHMLVLRVFVNGVLMETYPGDGLLLSTPTGSTAYALSAGGPVVDPALPLIVLTPVCSHMLFARPVLLSADCAIRVEAVFPPGGARRRFAHVELDGKPLEGGLGAGESLAVRRSERATRFVRFNKDLFYRTLKRKLYSRGEVLTREESGPPEGHP